MSYPNQSTNSIKSWAMEDRPREKMLSKGKKTLSTAELLAIIIGSGSMTESAVALAQRILSSKKNNLQELGLMSLEELQKFKGIGPAKAISISAALELGLRHQGSPVLKKPLISCSNDAYQVLVPYLSGLAHEKFYILLLSRANRVLDCVEISSGGLSGTFVDIKRIYRLVLANPLVSSIVLAHNHPSGSLQPSEADIELTRKIKRAGSYLDVTVFDHIILGYNDYASLADRGLM